MAALLIDCFWQLLLFLFDLFDPSHFSVAILTEALFGMLLGKLVCFLLILISTAYFPWGIYEVPSSSLFFYELFL